MFLGNTLSSAASGLDSIERQLALLSQNVANASTPNYVRQTLPLSSLDTAGGPAGVRTGLATRSMDQHLQANLFAAVATEAGSKVTQSALEGIDQVSGVPGSGQDLSSLVGALRDSFSTLSSDPASGPQQLDVLSKAGSLVGGVHTLGNALVQARQTAQDTLVQDVSTANDALHALGLLSDQIIATKAAGQSTADLEDQRDGQMRSLAQLTGARFVTQPNGDIEAIAGNSLLPLHAESGPFALGSANFNGATPSASVPVLMLDGVPAANLGGEIGANLTLRDTTLPTLQSSLDGFAQSLAASFQSQGLPLLTDGTGTVPPAGTAGFSLTIQVSAAAQANPTMVRDGTGPAGAAGDTTLINNVLQNVFSATATGLPAQASALVAGYAGLASQAKAAADTNTAVRSGLESRLSSVTGVSVDSELAHMIQLQSAYAANAKVITAVQDMWTQLLQAV
jgi:flagellar hook-associated protein 1 FlgK